MKDISELYELQKQLDERIIKEKGLEGQDLLPNTVLALLVEIAETANNWRGFKHWSKDQEPRYEQKCHACRGEGGFILGDGPEDGEICLYCEGTGIEARPLLEEYVDCLHFFLSIARQKGWMDALYLHEEAIEDIRGSGFDGGITGAFLEMKYWLLRMHMENKPMESIEKNLGYSTKEFCFRNAWFVFIAIGMIGFGFTWEQMCEAYLAKNKVNHDRQENGY